MMSAADSRSKLIIVCRCVVYWGLPVVAISNGMQVIVDGMKRLFLFFVCVFFYLYGA